MPKHVNKSSRERHGSSEEEQAIFATVHDSSSDEDDSDDLDEHQRVQGLRDFFKPFKELEVKTNDIDPTLMEISDEEDLTSSSRDQYQQAQTSGSGGHGGSGKSSVIMAECTGNSSRSYGGEHQLQARVRDIVKTTFGEGSSSSQGTEGEGERTERRSGPLVPVARSRNISQETQVNKINRTGAPKNTKFKFRRISIEGRSNQLSLGDQEGNFEQSGADEAGLPNYKRKMKQSGVEVGQEEDLDMFVDVVNDNDVESDNGDDTHQRQNSVTLSNNQLGTLAAGKRKRLGHEPADIGDNSNKYWKRKDLNERQCIGSNEVGASLPQKENYLAETSDNVNNQSDVTEMNSAAKTPGDISEENSVKVDEKTAMASEISRLKAELVEEKRKYADIVSKLQAKVECPVCFDVPKKAPVPVCPNGHVVCTTCVRELCPTCRHRMGDGKSTIAVTIIENIPHTCENQLHGCPVTTSLSNLSSHQAVCPSRSVRCPNFSCAERVPLTELAEHTLRRCIHNGTYKSSPLQNSYNYVVPAAQADQFDNRRNSTWRPDGISFDARNFFLKIMRKARKGMWYFYLMLAGTEVECQQYSATIQVFKPGVGTEGRHSHRFIADVCPIDVFSTERAADRGCCLMLSDALMKKIFQEAAGRPNGNKKFEFSVKVAIEKEAPENEAVVEITDTEEPQGQAAASPETAVTTAADEVPQPGPSSSTRPSGFFRPRGNLSPPRDNDEQQEERGERQRRTLDQYMDAPGLHPRRRNAVCLPDPVPAVMEVAVPLTPPVTAARNERVLGPGETGTGMGELVLSDDESCPICGQEFPAGSPQFDNHGCLLSPSVREQAVRRMAVMREQRRRRN